MISRSTDVRAALRRRQRGFILDPYRNAPIVYSAWNSADKDADISLSLADTLASISSANGLVRGTQSRIATTASHYFELKLSATGGALTREHLPGVAAASASLANFPGSDSGGWGFYLSNGNKYTNALSNVNQSKCVIGFIVNFTAGTLTVCRAGVSYPATTWSGMTGALFPMWGPSTSAAGTRTAVLNAGASTFVYDNLRVAAGASAWDSSCTWDSANKDADITLSNGDLTASITSPNSGAVRGTVSKSSGILYYEVTMDYAVIQATYLGHLPGVGNASATLTNSFPGANTNSYGYSPGDRELYTGGTGTAHGRTSDVYLGVGLSAGNLFFVADGAGQSSAYTGLTATVFPAWGPGSGTGAYQALLNTGGTAFAYEAQRVASGLSAWG